MTIARLPWVVLLVGAGLCAGPFARAGAEPDHPTGFTLPPLSLDPGFAGDGTLTLQIQQRDYARIGLFEPSGEMVLFGDSDDGHPSTGDAVMQRLAIDGTPYDPYRFSAQSFGCGVPRAFFTGMRLSSGNYLGGGFVQDGCGGLPRWFNALEISPQGQLQHIYDHVVFNNQLAYVWALAEQADGRIVAAGQVSTNGFEPTSFDFGVARFLADGTLDTSFANGGMYSFDLMGLRDRAVDIVIDPLGRILVVGYATTTATDRDILIIALDANGAIDESFGVDGIFRYDRAGGFDSVESAVRHRDGRILVAGTTSPSPDVREFSILAVNPNGTLDESFGQDGLVTVDFGSQTAQAYAITVGPNALIHVAGSAEIGGSGVDFNEVAVAVLRAEGHLDSRFNGGNGLTFSFGGLPRDFARGIDVDHVGGRILITGFTSNSTGTQHLMAAARLIGLDPQLFRDGFEAPD